MTFHSVRLKAITAVTVLVCFLWMACGGPAWAQSRAARRDPAELLLTLADNPRLALSPVEKEYLRTAAKRLQTQPRTAPARVPAVAVKSDPAATMGEIARQLDRLSGSGPVAPTAAAKRPDAVALADLEHRLESVDQEVRADFAAAEAQARAANLPQLILDRHQAARAAYEREMQAVRDDLGSAGRSDDPEKARAAVAAAARRLGGSGNERPAQPLDPVRLPFRTAKPVARQPGAAAGPAAATNSTLATQALPQLSSLLTPATPADLAANEDVQITPDIQALAASLGNQPLQIYNWVRNNVEFVPTYGSVQGSQMTLVVKRGNAFDTASLLIALLRAAGVPARYVTGTVEVPVTAVESWVGGAANSNVAQQLLGQGGVPNVGLSSNGMITHIRLDHVWVEAFVDNIPSRGAVQRAGDTWVPLDPAFKLHTFTPRSNLFTDNPISAVLQPGDHLFDVDEAIGKITNLDATTLDNRLLTWADQSDEYIATHGVQATVDGLLGGQAIMQQASTVFPASLPYRLVSRGTPVSTLPASLRHSVTLNGFASPLDRAFGNIAFAVKLSLPALNSRRLAIEFDPATQADADTLAAARSGGASSLPVYLVRVVPTVKLDGVAQGAGPSVQMGSSYAIDVVLDGPDGPTTVPYQVVAGDEIAVGVTGNGVGREVIEKRFADNPVNTSAEYLHQVGLHYWMTSDYLAGIAARPLGVHMLRLPSVGFFSSPLTVSYFFGVPRSAVYASRNMDVRQSLLGAAGTDPARVVAFVKQAGTQGSYLEGSVFDLLEGRVAPAIKGISAVQLISDAASQGVPIYRITAANAAAALPLLNVDSAVKSDVSTAVAQGKTALVPEHNIDIGPWSGVGYIIQDQTTGAGAYLISGGANGGGLLDCLRELLPQLVQILALALLILLLIILIALILAALAELIPVLVGAGAAAAEAFTAFLLLLRGLGSLSLAY
jgi:hypothetical protein